MAGVLTKRAHAEGDVVQVDELLAEIDESAAAGDGSPRRHSPPKPRRRAAASRHDDAGRASTPAPTAARSAARASRRARTRRTARRRGRRGDGRGPSTVQGTGRGGVVSKPDVIEAASRRPRDAGRTRRPPPQPTSRRSPRRAPRHRPRDGQRETREKMTTRRKRIAEHLLESQHATAHLTTFNEIDMTAVIAVRERLKERVEKEHGVKLSFMPFFVKAACMALKAYPDRQRADRRRRDRLQALCEHGHRGRVGRGTRRAEHQGRRPQGHARVLARDRRRSPSARATAS